MRVLLSLTLLLASCAKAPPVGPNPTQVDLSVVQPHKPPLDDRAYRLLRLGNGLRALLVSDGDTDMAAAALDVHLGQFSDPPDREGLAHFLEHMLFMGTERYPDVDGYRDFVQSHGGGTNAGTAQEHTRYHFDIEHPHLEEALDRFAQFFVAPLLDPAYVQREREAVNSEYELKVQDEARRFREVRRKTANPAHGFAKFSVGSLETLADHPDRPVWDDLRRFYADEYSASRMAIAVLGREDLDTLEQWVRARFGAVPTNGKGPPAQAVPAYLADQLGVRIDLRPLADERYLQLEFPVPPETPHFAEHPLELLTALLGQEGEGSPHAVLSRRGWITALRAGEDGTEDQGVLTVRLDLTEDGFAHVDEVVGVVFQYIRLLAHADTLAPWWEERRRIRQLDFAYTEPQRPTSAVQSAALSLQLLPPEHVLDGWATWSAYDDALIDRYLARLTPANLRVFVAGPGLETDRVEARYDVPWAIAPLDPEVVAAWTTADADPDLRLPAMNPYVAEDTTLHALAAAPGAPTRIVHEPGLEVWHLLDPTFEVPRATAQFDVVLPAATGSIANQVHARLFADLVDDLLTPTRDQLAAAGLKATLGATDLGLRLTLRGYDDKQADVLETYAHTLATYRVDPVRFDLVRRKLAQDWRNTTRQRSVNQASWALGEALDPTAWSFTDGADHLEHLRPEALQAWLDGLFAQRSLRVLVHGNHTAAEAEALARGVAGALPDAVVAAFPPARVRRIPNGETILRDLTVAHGDSAIRVLVQASDDTRATQARWMLLGSLIRTPVFTQLRTEEQLGYVVWGGVDARDHVYGLTLGIQSNVAPPPVLLERIDAFLSGYDSTLEALDASEFETVKRGLIANLLEAPSDLDDKSAALRRDLALGVTTFDHAEQLVAQLEPLTHADLLAFFRAEVLGKDVGRLVVRALGQTHADQTMVPGGCPDTACVAARMTGVFERDRSAPDHPPNDR